MIYGRKVVGTVGVMSGIPVIPTNFMWSFQKMTLYNERYVTLPNEEILYIGAPFSLHSAARNSLANKTQGDWLFMLDTDQEFDADVLGKLLYTMYEYDLDIVTGVAYQKGSPYLPLVYIYEENLGGFQILSKIDSEDVVKVGAAGGGCLLIRNHVFDKIFYELEEQPFDIIGPLGEDLSFFERCRKLDIEVWCDPKVEIGHLKFSSVTKEDNQKEILNFNHEFKETVLLQKSP